MYHDQRVAVCRVRGLMFCAAFLANGVGWETNGSVLLLYPSFGSQVYLPDVFLC